MRTKLLISFSVLLSFSTPALSQELTILTEDSPPFQYQENGKIIGIASDIVAAVFAKAALPYKHEMIPWQRAYSKAKDEANTCVYSTTLTDERKPLFKWVSPLVSNDWVIMVPSDSKITATNLNELKGTTIGGYIGDAVADYLKKEGHKVDEAANDTQNAKKLATKRIEAWATSSVVGPFLAKKDGITNIKHLFTFRQTTMGIACNKNVSDDIISKLSKALEALRADGTISKIEAKYK